VCPLTSVVHDVDAHGHPVAPDAKKVSAAGLLPLDCRGGLLEMSNTTRLIPATSS